MARPLPRPLTELAFKCRSDPGLREWWDRMQQQLMADPEKTAAFLESLTAGYACRSWFCRDRGPVLTKTFAAAEQLAEEHRALRWLGLFPHRVIVYRMNPDQLQAGQALAEFMRRSAGGDAAAT